MTTKCRGRSVLVAAGVAALLLAGAPTAQAQAAAVPHPGPFGEILKCLRVLDLTDAQKRDIRAVLEAAKPEAEALHATFQVDRAAMKSALEKTPPDPCEVGTAALKLKGDREARRTLFEKVKDGILAILSPVQQAKLAGCLEAPRDASPANGLTEPEE